LASSAARNARADREDPQRVHAREIAVVGDERRGVDLRARSRSQTVSARLSLSEARNRSAFGNVDTASG
jgi:hypothetical protein